MEKKINNMMCAPNKVSDQAKYPLCWGGGGGRPAKSPDLGRRLSAFSLHCRLSGFEVHFTGEIENLLAFFFQMDYFIIYGNQISIRYCSSLISIDRAASHCHRCQTD